MHSDNNDFLLLKDGDVSIVSDFDDSSDSDDEKVNSTSTTLDQHTQSLNSDTEKADKNADPPADIGFQEFDLVIVGGGVAGLYTLWNLLVRNPVFYKYNDGCKVLLIEQCRNTGGRLVTDIIKDRDGADSEIDSFYNVQKCEEGGMRFCLGTHIMPLLTELIDVLKLQYHTIPEKCPNYPDLTIVKFPMQPKNLDCRRQWFNGERFTKWYAEQNPSIWSRVFYLKDAERNKSGMDIFVDAYVKVLVENKYKLISLVGAENANILIKLDLTNDYKKIRRIQQNEDFWPTFRKSFTYGNTPINAFSMKSLLTTLGYSQGCIMMLNQSTGFWCFTEGPGNAGVVIQMIITHATMEPDFKCFKYGFQTIIQALEYDIQNKTKCKIRTSNQLQTIKPVSKTSSLVGAPYEYELVIKKLKTNSKQNMYKVRAKKIILAVPQKALQNIYLIPTDAKDVFPVNKLNGMSNNPIGSQDGTYIPRHIPWPYIDTVSGVEMTKINLYFDYPWWNSNHDTKLYGPNTTNLPLAQVYTFYSYKEEFDEASDLPGDIKDELKDTFCCMTVYCDITSSKFWADLQDLMIGPKFTSRLQMKYKDLNAASIPVVKEILREFALLFDTDEIPYPVLTTYTRWDGKDCNSDAIHQWNKHVDDRAVIEAIAQPFVNQSANYSSCSPYSDIYICNEAWSGFQGWVEGSLQAAQNVLGRFIKPVPQKNLK